jgi:SAM-dependent methyltransferase
MDERLRANREWWDELVDIHVRSQFYDVDGFKAGRNTLSPIELGELGDVAGKALLHLQCHFGLDTLSWARLGARVTGVDFSPSAIESASELAGELGIEAEFVEADIYDLPQSLDERFDIVFTSYGVLCWLPDLDRWAAAAARCLRPGGFFYVAEFHPFADVFDDQSESMIFRYPYFSTNEPFVFQGNEGSYADRTAILRTQTVYSWTHSLGDVVNAVLGAGLSLDFLHEFPYSPEAGRPWMTRSADGLYRAREHDGLFPLVFSLKATKR